MKTYTNKMMAIFALLAVSIFLVTFCTQAVENQMGGEEFVNTDEILQQFQTVGLLHNKVMAEVISDFQNYDGTFEHREDYFDFLEESLVKNLSSTDLLSKMSEEDIRDYIIQEINQVKTYYKNKFDKSVNNSNILQYTVSQYSGYLNPQQLEILQRIDNIIENSFNTETMIIALQMVNNSQEVQNLVYEDRLVIYAATSVGIESALYWEAHYIEWVDILIREDLSMDGLASVDSYDFYDSSQWFNGRRMVRTEVAGGVGGAVVGCMAGSVAGGVGCIPGAATTGLISAAGASTADAMSQILDRFF